MSLSQEAVLRLIAQAVPDMARRAVKTLDRRLGYVQADQDPSSPFVNVLVDGNDGGTAQSMLSVVPGMLTEGERVAIDFYPPHGVMVVGRLSSGGMIPSRGAGLEIVTYTTPGSFSFLKADYPGMIGVRAIAVGGGGGGGGASGAGPVAAGASGGSGAYAESVLAYDDLAASETVTVGAGGSGGGPGTSAGTVGGASSFGSHVVAGGGDFGDGGGATSAVNRTAGGAPGVATAGQIQITGNSGCAGQSFAARNSADSGSIVVAEASGNSGAILGGAARSNTSANATGMDGLGYGAGGSGTWATNTNSAGGDGGGGIVIVYVIY